jgi:serine/threonine protein phosphatase PrpC
LILACDGVWDVMNNEDSVAVVLRHADEGAEIAARALATEAYRLGSQDNISCVVCLLEGRVGCKTKKKVNDAIPNK